MPSVNARGAQESNFARMVSWIDTRFRVAVGGGEDWAIVLDLDGDVQTFTADNFSDFAKTCAKSSNPNRALVSLSVPEGTRVVLTSALFEEGEWLSSRPTHAVHLVADDVLSVPEHVFRMWHEHFPNSPYDRIVADEDASQITELADFVEYAQMLKFLGSEITEPGTIGHITVLNCVGDDHYARFQGRLFFPPKGESIIPKLLELRDILVAQVLVLTPRSNGRTTHAAAVALLSPDYDHWLGLAPATIRKMKCDIGPLRFFDTSTLHWMDWGSIAPNSPAVSEADCESAPATLRRIRKRIRELSKNLEN